MHDSTLEKSAEPAETGTTEAASNRKIRGTIADFVEHNVADLQQWLDKIAKEDGSKAAFDRLLRVMEYHLPKRSRGETERDSEPEVKVVELQRF